MKFLFKKEKGTKGWLGVDWSGYILLKFLNLKLKSSEKVYWHIITNVT